MLHAALIVALAINGKTPCNNEFLQESWALLATARYGHSPYEQAAWAVADAEGRVTFVRWKFNHEAWEAKFRGVIPANAVALVHTHPNFRPMPSDDDSMTAQRLRMPVYVLTRKALTRTNGSRVEYVALGDWNPERCARR